MRRLLPALLILALALPSAGDARTLRAARADELCGSEISSLAIAHARHRLNQRRLARARLSESRIGFGEAASAAGPKVTRKKNVAVIEDDGTIVSPPNPFDLERSGVQFLRSGNGIRGRSLSAGVEAHRGERITIGDDESRVIDLPFEFRFFGVRYQRVFLNSDGNLTFEFAESSSTARSLSRFLEGPPRIAANFVDLDPTAASGDGGVYLLSSPERVRITWLEVPEYGTSNRNTIQLTLYPGGRITVAFGEIDAVEGIVGVAPGRPGRVELVDLSEELPLGRRLDAVAERFRSQTQIDDLAVAAATLAAVRDDYGHIVVFADFPVDLGGAFAYHLSVQNAIEGIGLGTFDISSLFGSEGGLESFVQMGSLSGYPSSPERFISPFGEATGIGVLAHEVGHRWLAHPAFRDAQGRRSGDLLGRQQAHWSFVLDSDGSVMEGNDIRDNGDGSFTTVASWRGFSPLDQYLMGLRPPGQVPPFFYVANSGQDPEASPQSGVRIEGTRRDVTIDQIIAAEGPRVPAADQAPKKFFVAFVLLGRQGQPPSNASVDLVNRYRNRLASFMRQATGGRARIGSSLKLRPAAP